MWSGDRGVIGLVPKAARPGDFCSVIYGCDVPIVLRQWADGYKVIGEAYLHGFMRDEALRLVDEGTLAEQDLKLY
jgi:hypothetical protein